MIITKQCPHCRSYPLIKQPHLYCEYKFEIYKCDCCDRYSKWDKDFDNQQQKISNLLDGYYLNNWEKDFCESLLDFRYLSYKQLETLNKIWKKYKCG